MNNEGAIGLWAAIFTWTVLKMEFIFNNIFILEVYNEE